MSTAAQRDDMATRRRNADQCAAPFATASKRQCLEQRIAETAEGDVEKGQSRPACGRTTRPRSCPALLVDIVSSREKAITPLETVKSIDRTVVQRIERSIRLWLKWGKQCLDVPKRSQNSREEAADTVTIHGIDQKTCISAAREERRIDGAAVVKLASFHSLAETRDANAMTCWIPP